MEQLQQYWWIIPIVVVAVALLWWAIAAGRKPTELEDGPTTAKDPAEVPTYVARSPTGLGGPPPEAETPVAETTPGKPAIAAAVGDPDDLKQIKGIGPKLNKLLAEMGIIRFDQIAAWSEADIAEVDQFLGNFQGRITNDNWVDQATYLAQGDIAGFEAKYGKV